MGRPVTTLTISEAAFQTQVTDLATALGWHYLHVRRSIGRRDGKQAWQTTTNIAGWPDLFLWHPRHGFAALELKSEKARLNTDTVREQLQVLDQLAGAGARTLLARPSDLDAIRAILEGRTA